MQEAGMQEVQSHPQMFSIVKNPDKISENRTTSVKIWAKSLKMFTKSHKIWANFLKMRTKMAPNVVWFEKNGVGGHSRKGPRDLCGRKYSNKKLPENFSFFGQVSGKFGLKSFVPPKFDCSYTCSFSSFTVPLLYCCFGFRHPW